MRLGAMASDGNEYYDLLGVDRDATTQEIRQAFRKLALTAHPDRGGDAEAFQRLSRAHEVLSDSKARARYDATGRTAALTVEEELRESFFSGGGLFGGGGGEDQSKGRAKAGSGATAEQRAAAAAKETERQEAMRRAAETERRDAERRNRAAGGTIPRAPVATLAPPQSTAEQPPAPEPQAVPSAGFSVGDKVRVDGLKTQPELNGELAILVEQRGERWRVRFENGKGDKLLRAANLFIERPHNTTQAPSPAPEKVCSDCKKRGKLYRWKTGDGNFYCAPCWEKWEKAQAGGGGGYPAADSAQGASTNGPPQPGGGAETVLSFLRAARSSWSASEADSVRSKLAKVNINELSELLHAIRSNKLNERLRASGEKGFTTETMIALREQAKTADQTPGMASASTPKAVPAQGKASNEAPSKAARSQPAELPTQQYRVVVEFVYVRQEAKLKSPVLGKKVHGDVVVASEETFDGWVRLVGEAGWAIKDMHGQRGVGQVLAPVGRPPTLAVPNPVEEEGPQTFEVVFSPHVALRQAPSKSGTLLGVKKHGQKLLAEVQTYGGWVRLREEDGGGWVLSHDAQLGKLLSCNQLDARAAVEEALSTPDASKLQSALINARKAGVSEDKLKPAQNVMGTMREEAAQRRELLNRIGQAGTNEHELRACLDESVAAGFTKEASLAQRFLDELAAERKKIQESHASLLEELAAATASGNSKEIKAARDKAKREGVPMKEIARIFAIQSSTAVDAAPEPAEVGMQPHVVPVEVAEDTLSQGASPPAPAEQPEEATGPSSAATLGMGAQHPLDGRWQGLSSGEYMATIEGSTIWWADGPGVEFDRTSETTGTCEMFGERFHAELDGDGRLVWSDGDIWVLVDSAAVDEAAPAAADANGE